MNKATLIITALAIVALGGAYYYFSPHTNLTTSITLLSPQGGETIAYNTDFPITWKISGSVKNDYRVAIELNHDGKQYYRIGGVNAEASGSYTWHVFNDDFSAPNVDAPPRLTITNGSYTIRLRLFDGNLPCEGYCPPETPARVLAADESASFTIFGVTQNPLEKQVDGLLKKPAENTPAQNPPIALDPVRGCTQNVDCVLLTCAGAFNKEYVKHLPPEPPCMVYEGYSAACIQHVCTPVKK